MAQSVYTYAPVERNLGAYGLLLSKTRKTDAATTVHLRNTLDASGKHVLRTETYVNQSLTARTDYSYDSFGNTGTQLKYVYTPLGLESAVVEVPSNHKNRVRG